MADKKLQGVNVVMVIAPEQFRDEELLEPKQVLVEAGALVTVASTRSGEAKGMLGAKVMPDKTVTQIEASDYQGMIVVGGMGSPDHLWHDTTLHALLSQCQKQGKVVAGICLSGAVLANAGVLKGKRATVWATPESLQCLELGDAQYMKEHVVVDGNVITADGPEAATEFGEAVKAALLTVATKV